MFASAPIHSAAEPFDTGFEAPRHRLTLLALRERIDEMVVFYVVAIALLAAIVVPAWQSAMATPVVERIVAVEPAAPKTTAKSDRLRNPAIDLACSGVTYGNETSECLVAIAEQGGRQRSGDVRIIAFGNAGNG